MIGSLLSSPPENGQLQQELQTLAEKSYQHPLVPDKQISPGFSTIERWYYQAKDAPDPITALGQKLRADAGLRWTITEVLKSSPPQEVMERHVELHDYFKAFAAPQQAIAMPESVWT